MVGIDSNRTFDNNHICGNETGVSSYLYSVGCRYYAANNSSAYCLKPQEKIQQNL